jgi:hypothetical protein
MHGNYLFLAHAAALFSLAPMIFALAARGDCRESGNQQKLRCQLWR